ncbi:hypothetical protein [Mesorhizobium sp.]|uniref:hypothetical protein n=1 Tax=Mesorhizobium sp. TaxID=1871066 RepID=UPI000FE9C774|nr:hypothetical protein [Mesorhizobium sp.]RWG24586.1 MAG: hypothetical protein EOQ60_32115 [Mesorhizobium sp.]
MNMVERVAKAISRSIPLDGSRWHSQHGHDFPRQYSEREQNIIRGIARAAIEAMREPTDEMLAAGSRAIFHYWQANAAYRAMIDAALSQNTLHSSSVPSMLGVSTAMTTLAAEESVVPNSDPRPTSSPVSEQAGGEASPPVVSPSAAQFPE